MIALKLSDIVFLLLPMVFSQLSHTHVVQFLGIYTAPPSDANGNPIHYIVTEYLPKGSLSQTLVKEKHSLDSLRLLDM